MPGEVAERRALTEPGLVAAWGFDEATGTTASDATCKGHTAMLTNQAHVTGKFGGALQYTTDFVSVADAADLRLTTGMTVEAWVNPASGGGSWELVAAKQSSSALAYGMYAWSSTIPLARLTPSSGIASDLTAGTKPVAGTWTHLAMTFDGAMLRLYENGAQVGSKSVTNSIGTSTQKFAIGGHDAFGAPSDIFVGLIDEVRVYDRALSAAEIVANKDQPIGACGATGTAGTTGSAGTTGRGGTSGSAGTTGRGGTTGSAGTTGRGGTTGNAGTSGSAGTSGTAGTSGSAGTSGNAGTTGSAGTGGGGAAGSGGALVYPLKLAAGKHYLVDQQNRPYFLVGEAAWSLIVSPTLADADFYLADRQARGINTVIVNLIEHHYAPNPPRNLAGDLPFTGVLAGGARDFSTPNEAYFAHADAVIRAAATRGIQILLDASYLGYQGGDEGWYQDMVANGTTRLTTYGSYVGNRYRSFPNILWVGGADYDPPDVSGVDAVQTAIRAADPNHLHTGHVNSGEAALDVYGWTSWLKVNDVYGYPALGQYVYAASQAQYTRADWQPFFLVESTYEHNHWVNPPPTALLIRQQAYEAVLNGGFGQLFGNAFVWPFGVVGLNGTAQPWRPNLDSQGARDMSRLANLFSGRHWEQLVPDTRHTFLTAGFSSGTTFASASVSTDGKLAMLYTPAARNLTVNMAKMSGSTTARWFDPTSGTYSTVSGSPFANFGSRVFNPGRPNAAGAGDWVLLLQAP